MIGVKDRDGGGGVSQEGEEKSVHERPRIMDSKAKSDENGSMGEWDIALLEIWMRECVSRTYYSVGTTDQSDQHGVDVRLHRNVLALLLRWTFLFWGSAGLLESVFHFYPSFQGISPDSDQLMRNTWLVHLLW